ncbi:hypothetical protein PPTG_21394 [Phytophthora nicotianae INRA-310]|uniref:Uncharacterized protein n=1 Tax=Phytophthora nicotianae (strain INRA-310) TaxID=761204 RepID=W2R2S7_PHYN3|nr:hypothetical protein PPTG_21394 [Phytophthora nicotianae INRA-310]ETN19014.1 hypothetical protein PPTG_21394 [Phytophthora nicotianae INRA-310]
MTATQKPSGKSTFDVNAASRATSSTTRALPA